MKIEIVTHFPKNDPDCQGDYDHVTVENAFVQDSEKKVIVRYGDYYHEKGQERAEAFVQGMSTILETMNQSVEVVKKDVADAEEWL